MSGGYHKCREFLGKIVGMSNEYNLQKISKSKFFNGMCCQMAIEIVANQAITPYPAFKDDNTDLQFVVLVETQF